MNNRLFVRNVPHILSDEEVKKLFAAFGGTNSWRKYAGAYVVEFPTPQNAAEALRGLEGFQMMGSILRADFHISTGQRHHSAVSANKFIKSKLGFIPHYSLEYTYPPPTDKVLDNICFELMGNDKFYTQVLHLMNKMCLPCPFYEYRYQIPAKAAKEDVEMLKNEESDTVVQSMHELPAEVAPKGAEDGSRIKLEIERPQVRGRRRRIEFEEEGSVEKKKPRLDILVPLAADLEEGVDQMAPHIADEPESADDSSVSDSEKGRRCVSRAHLLKNRMTSEEMQKHSHLARYVPGEPSKTLYIKNVPKKTTAGDLKWIYRSFFGSDEEADASLGIDVFQKGRLRGQAYVTFPTVELARAALTDTNGFLMKGRPIVVAFSRSKGKKTT